MVHGTIFWTYPRDLFPRIVRSFSINYATCIPDMVNFTAHPHHKF